MFNKQLYLFVVSGLLMVGGFFSSTRILAVSPSEHESVPLIQYWNIIADQLADSLISRGRFGESSISVDRNKSATMDVVRYLESRLTTSLAQSAVSAVKVGTLSNARYVIELDIDINERSNGHETVYTEGGDIDQLWRIQELPPAYPGQYVQYQIIPLDMNQPADVNPLSGTDREVLITVRVMERGWIYLLQHYAFYFTAENLQRENGWQRERADKTENDENLQRENGWQHERADKTENDNDGVFVELQSHHGAFIQHQRKLDADIEQLIDSYQF